MPPGWITSGRSCYIILNRNKKVHWSSTWWLIPNSYLPIVRKLHQYLFRGSFSISHSPYFFPGKGRPSLDPRKNKCRFFIEGSYGELLNFFKLCLLPEGKGYILYRENGEKSMEVFQELFLEFGSYFSFSKRPLDKKTNLLVVSILDKKGN